jgi:hypothetical protein
MKKFNTSMFESIKGALAGQEEKTSFNNILQLEVGNTYTVRLLPNIESLEKTFMHYYVVGWESFSTGQYVQFNSPTTYGERDPILEARYKIYKHGSDQEKLKIANVKRGEKWLVNAYIVDDPKNPENNGQVRVIRYGKQLEKIIRRAIDGEDASDLGSRIFDLTPNGVNLKIEIEKQGDYPTYVSSRFVTSKSDLGLSEEKMSEIYSSIHNLDSMVPVKSFDELEAAFEAHYNCGDTKPEKERESRTDNKPSYNTTTATSSNDAEDDDPIVAELLAGIN